MLSLRRAMAAAILAAAATTCSTGCTTSESEPAATVADRGGSASSPAGLTDVVQALRGAGRPAGLGEPVSVHTYLPERMYEAIDGEADLFHAYDSRWLAAARYKVGQAIVDAEVFDQAEPINAFGVYSQLRGRKAASVAVGVEGVNVADEAIHFWKSRYVVRVSSTGAERPPFDALLRLSDDIAEALKGSSALPAWTTALPRADGKRGRVQYVARNVLGHGFLSNAMIADYQQDGGECTLALVRAANEAKVVDAWTQLKRFYDGRAAKRELAGLGDQGFVGTGPGQRKMHAVRCERYVMLVTGECDAAQARGLLKATLDRLRKIPEA